MKDLIEKAIEYKLRAYAPYSNFSVGAAVKFDNNKIYGGCNIENASYGATNCAERTAIFTGIASGGKKITEIAIVALESEYITPCGICLQVISEFATKETNIYLVKNKDEYKKLKFSDLMPSAFTSDYLK